MEIAATPATVPPAIAPVFELCPPTGPGLGVVVFEEPPTVCDREDVVIVLGFGVKIVLGPIEEDTAGPSIVPGPSSGLPVRRWA
jgi:hypothetical protein